MPELLLPSLEIQNFRAFEHLHIERLGRVNLITGKNNVGKTSLLEALYLYAHGGAPYRLRDLLAARQELNIDSPAVRRAMRDLGEKHDYLANIRYLFHGRKEIHKVVNPIIIGPADQSESLLSLKIEWFQEVAGAGTGGLGSPAHRLEQVPVEDRTTNAGAVPYVISRMGEQLPFQASLEQVLDGYTNMFFRSVGWPCEYVKPNGLSNTEVGTFWDRVSLTPDEDTVIAALKIISPDVERISIVADQHAASERVPVIRMRGETERIPLRSLGDGINRLLGIILALIYSDGGIFLVDEVETGLHYSMMPDVWRLIFQVAQQLDVQVFATTHSWDCIEAFERAARGNADADGELIHLVNKEDKLFAVIYDDEELQIVTRESIEVR